jgi:ArsR family transcriptional regulator
MQRLIELSKIFSDKNRANIVLLVLRDKEVCVCEICDTLALSQPLVSRHLKQIKKAKILEARKEKKWVNYSLNKAPDKLLQCFIQEFKTHISTLPNLVICSTK